MRLNNALSFLYVKQGAAKGWPPERRMKQSARMRAKKIWRRSTGPSTISGKATCAYNAIKHGQSCAEWRELRKSFGVYRRYLKHVRFIFASWLPEEGRDAERNAAWNRALLQSYVPEVT